jgi:hypothetical protein
MFCLYIVAFQLTCCSVIGFYVSGSSVNTNSTQTVVIGDPNASRTIVMGYLMDQLVAPYRIGAISKAINEGQANGLLQGFNFT